MIRTENCLNIQAFIPIQASIQTLAFISYHLPVQDIMVGANTSIIRAIHVYKTTWTPLIHETLYVHHVGRYQQTRQIQSAIIEYALLATYQKRY